MRVTGVRPEVGAPLIHLPLSANFFCSFYHFERPIFRFWNSMAIFRAFFSEKDEV